MDQVDATLALTPSGLEDLSVVVGPAPVPAGPVELRPVLAVFAGAAPAGGRRVELGLDLDGTRRFAAEWLLDVATVQLAVLEDSSPPETDPAAVASRAGRGRRHPGGVDRARPRQVQHLLAMPSAARPWGSCCAASCSKNDDSLDPAVFAPADLLRRVARLLDNLAGANLAVTIDGSLSVGIAKDAGGVLSVTLGLGQRVQLTSGDVTVWLEADDTWIEPRPPVAGVAVGLVKLTGDTVTLTPRVTVSGLGHPRRAPERAPARPRSHARVRRAPRLRRPERRPTPAAACTFS